ncbi:MAG: tetratricopeptide repeat protein [Candidatus Thorarchaeota archaeon]
MIRNNARWLDVRANRIQWLNDIRESSKGTSIVAYIHGMEGIGKSTLLMHWKETESNGYLIQLDQIDHDDRYSTFDKRINRVVHKLREFGFDLPRFDSLWMLKMLREGIHPIGHPDLAKSSLVAFLLENVPTVKYIVGGIEGARELGERVRRAWAKSRFGDVGKWLRNRFESKKWNEVWIEKLDLPSSQRFDNYEYLCDAIQEDMKNQKKEVSILLMFDAIDTLETEEICFWYKLLLGLKNCVGISSGALPLHMMEKGLRDSKIPIADIKGFHSMKCEPGRVNAIPLNKFDDSTCRDVMNDYGVTAVEIQDAIIKASQGYPMMVGVLCNAINEEEGIKAEEINKLDLGNHKLDKALEIVIKRLLSRVTKDELKFIEHVSLIPFFNESILRTMEPTSVLVDVDITKYAFVSRRSDGHFQIHDMVRPLLIAHIRKKHSDPFAVYNPIIERLFEGYTRSQGKKPHLIGVALSIIAIFNERGVIGTIEQLIIPQFQPSPRDLIIILRMLTIENNLVEYIRCIHLAQFLRVSGNLSESFETLEKVLENDIQDINIEDLILTRMYKATALWNQGCVLESFWKLEQAEKCFNESLSLCIEIESKSPKKSAERYQANNLIALNYKEIVSIYVKTRNPKEVMDMWHDVLSTFENRKDLIPEETYLMCEYEIQAALANYLFDIGNIKDASEFYRALVNLNQKLSQDSDEVLDVGRIFEPLIQLGRCLVYMGDFEEAERHLLEADRICSKYNLTHSAQEDIGFLYVEWGKHFLLDYMKNHDIHLTHSDAIKQVSSLDEMWTKAEEAYKKALSHSRLLADRLPELHTLTLANSMNELGTHYITSKKFQEAEEVLTNAIKLVEKAVLEYDIESPRINAVIKMNLASVLRSTDRLEEAETLYTDALTIFEAITKESPAIHQKDLAMIYTNLGSLSIKQSHFDKAEEYLFRSYVIYEHLSGMTPRFFEESLSNVIGLMIDLIMKRDGEEAAEAEKKCIDQLPTRAALYPVPSDEVLSLVVMERASEEEEESLNSSISTGLALIYRGDFDSAETILKKCEQKCHDRRVAPYLVARVLDAFGFLYATRVNVHLQLAQHTDASASFETILDQNESLLPGLQESERYHSRALEIRRSLALRFADYEIEVASTLHNFGVLYYYWKRYKEAEDALVEAIALYEPHLDKAEYQRKQSNSKNMLDMVRDRIGQ